MGLAVEKAYAKLGILQAGTVVVVFGYDETGQKGLQVFDSQKASRDTRHGESEENAR